MIKITSQGFKSATSKMSSVNPNDILGGGLKRLVEFTENRIGINANRYVYGYKPKTNRYKRTGNLLGGRGNAVSGGKPNTTQVGQLTFRVEANPKLKGASFNYAPYVNKGKGWMRRVGARPFWDVSVKEAKAEAPRILKSLKVFDK